MFKKLLENMFYSSGGRHVIFGLDDSIRQNSIGCTCIKLQEEIIYCHTQDIVKLMAHSGTTVSFCKSTMKMQFGKSSLETILALITDPFVY